MYDSTYDITIIISLFSFLISHILKLTLTVHILGPARIHRIQIKFFIHGHRPDTRGMNHFQSIVKFQYPRGCVLGLYFTLLSFLTWNSNQSHNPSPPRWLAYNISPVGMRGRTSRRIFDFVLGLPNGRVGEEKKKKKKKKKGKK